MTTGQRRSSTRERFRELVREDVKTLALKQLAEGGAQAISLKAIAKEIGVSAPALYRYYANRDELLNILVVDAYHDLRDALAREAAACERMELPRDRLHLVAHAYRRWANEHPHRYELLFKPPFPGYDAHAVPIATAAGTLMDVVLAVLGDADPTPPRREATASREWDSAGEQLAIRLWTRLHGFINLELGGAYTATDIDADALFESEVRALAQYLDQDALPSVDSQAREDSVVDGTGTS